MDFGFWNFGIGSGWHDGEDYVHRIGRTGRKGRSGRAISFASGREVFQIRNIERYVGTRIHRGQPPTLDEVEEARANAVLDRIRGTLKRGDYKRQDQLVERLLEEGFGSTDIVTAMLHELQRADMPAERPTKEAPRMGTGPPGRDRRDARVQPRLHARPEDRHQSRGAERSLRNSEPPPQSPNMNRAPGPTEAREQARHEPSQPAQHQPPSAAANSRPPHRAEKPAGAMGKPKRRLAEGKTRLFISAGSEMGVSEPDLGSAISGQTGLPSDVLSAFDIRERHSFVDVPSEHANSIIAKLNRSQIKGRKVKVKVA